MVDLKARDDDRLAGVTALINEALDTWPATRSLDYPMVREWLARLSDATNGDLTAASRTEWRVSAVQEDGSLYPVWGEEWFTGRPSREDVEAAKAYYPGREVRVEARTVTVSAPRRVTLEELPSCGGLVVAATFDQPKET